METKMMQQNSQRSLAEFLRDERPALVGGIVVVVLLVVAHVYYGGQWIGVDNDDLLRAVQVRDLLGDQGWFDLRQYRLGLEDGTLMHWSRLVDAPIAGLQLLLSVFFSRTAAEQIAVFVWPLLLVLPFMTAIGVGARRLGGGPAVVPALIMGGFFVMTIEKFAPGRIDHHNVQITLMAVVIAGLLDRRMTVHSFAISGFAAAFAIAVGAEAAPLVAIACAFVAILWIWNGARAKGGVLAYCAAFATGLALAFVGTVPPSEYGAVYCDAYSSVFFLLGTLGAGGLVLLAATMTGTTMTRVLGVLSVGMFLVGAALFIAPHCLQSPLNDLDPVLREAWLAHVSEAQSLLSMARFRPYSLGYFYAVPVFALIVCAVFAWKGYGTLQLLGVALLMLTAFVISVVQVRGAYFGLHLVIPPMAWFVSIMRARGTAASARRQDALVYLIVAITSLPVFWGVAGIPFHPDFMNGDNVEDGVMEEACATTDAYAELARLPEGVVASVSNLGAEILLSTPHRVLSAPYHRNERGMLAAHRIFSASATTAIEHLRASGTTWVVICRSEPETQLLVRTAPGGLMADLVSGDVPEYLELLERGSAIEIYGVRR